MVNTLLKSPALVMKAQLYLQLLDQGASMERMSLSSSPPSSRLPPDGHEFPANYDENAVDLSSSKCRPQRSSGGNPAANWRSNRDERSERSVRDKIALFTHDDRGQIRSAAAAATTTTPTVASTTPLKSRRENTSLGSSPTDTKYVAKTLSYSVDNLSSSVNNNSNGTSNNNNNNNNNSTSATLKALQGSTKGPLSCGLPRSRDFAATTGESSNLSERSRSLLDVAQSSQKRHSVGNLAATLAQRKTSLMNLAESRRKSISKLRGLVIPDPVEMKSDARLRSPRGIIDLPEIISKDSVLAQGKAVNLPTLSRTDPLRGSQSSVTSSTSSDATDSALKKTSLTSLPWKSNSASNTLPKYSPAFKRKELTVPRSYVLDSGQAERPAPTTKTGTTATIDIVKQTPPVPLLPLPPLPTSKPPAVSPAKDLIDVVDSRTPSTVTSSHSHEESSDTDGDSALSSSRSSFSQSESPIPSADNKDEAKISHQESSTAAVTAAATAARVLKAHSVEALNRKNVLQSARYSSGGGLDSPTSPPTPTESRPLKLSSPNRSSDSLSSPKDPSPLLARSRKAPDFEQTLKMFASSEKEAKNERMSPKSLRSGDRLEIKTAFINDVYDDPSSIQTTNDRMDIKVSPVDVTVLPTPATRKISSGSESSRRNSNEMDSKLLASKPSGGNGNIQRETPREVKSFRALAERWEAMVNDTPVSSGPSSPLSPPAKSFPPVQSIAAAASKKLDVKVNEDDDDYSIKRFSLMSKLAHETGMSYESSVDHGDHESSFTLVTSSISTNNSSRSSKSMAGVVEIRKAFERVRGELETESSSNMDLPMGLNSSDELSSETFNIFKPHGIFSMSSNSNFATNSGCSTSYHTRMSSLDSNTSGEDSSFPYGGFGHYGIGIGLRDHYGSITSLASSTSLISPQELQQLLDDANQSLEESGTPSHEIVVVVLHRGDASGPASLGLGITLAGGADYETKEITVHKVISGSVADRDGRVQRGDRVLSINGKSLKGVTHREALAILKAPRPEVVLVLSRKRSVSPQDSCSDDKDLPMMITASNTIINSRIGSSGHVISSRPPRILESPSDFGNYDSEDVGRGPPLTTTLIKDGAGLGFSLEGGKDSPLGDRPLTVKKIFTGGAASKNGVLRVGDQIITVNGCDVTVMSRIEAWNLMKKLPDGVVTLVIRQSLNPASS